MQSQIEANKASIIKR
jgi:hypothetical protein